MRQCPNCQEEVKDHWTVCPFCSFKFSEVKQKSDDSVIAKSNISQSGGRGSAQRVSDTVVQRSDVRQVDNGASTQVVSDSVVQGARVSQKSGTAKKQRISDSVAVGSVINQESSTAFRGSPVSADSDNEQLMYMLQQAASSQSISDSVIKDSEINLVQTITAKFEVTGLEYLICDNLICRESLRLSETQKNSTDIRSVILLCSKCGTNTPFKKALDNAQEYLSSIGKMYGDLAAQLKEGDLKDGRIRSYIFQKDVVDNLATKFMDICHFIHPVVSTPYSPQHPTEGKTIEYGLYMAEYIEMIMTDSKLAKNPYVIELAGDEDDRIEADKQSTKLRAIAYMIWGFNNLYHLCEGIRSRIVYYPQSGADLGEIITYFKAARKTCEEGSRAHPYEGFFTDLLNFTNGVISFLTAQHMYMEYVYAPELFEDGNEKMLALGLNRTFSLDQTKHSTVFTTPGKKSLRKKAEEKLRNSSSSNSSIISTWHRDVSAIPATVADIAERYKSMIRSYINSRKTISLMRVSQGLLLVLAALLAFYNYMNDELYIILVGFAGETSEQLNFAVFAVLILITLILGHIAKINHVKCCRIKSDFNFLTSSGSQSVKEDVFTRSFNCSRAQDQMTKPLTDLESYWMYDISVLTWVFGSKADSLRARLAQIPSSPNPMRRYRYH